MVKSPDVPWQRVQLGDLLTRITYGFTNPMPTTDSGPTMVTAKDIRGGRIDYGTARHTSVEAFRERLTDKSRPRVGDILLTKDGSIGRVAVCDRDDICINQSVALLQLKSGVNPRFLAYLLQAPRYQAAMAADADGSTIKHIYITRVDKMAIEVPDAVEQKAIADVLGAFDDKIAANDRSIALADDLAASLTTAQCEGSVRLDSIADVVMGSSPPGTSYNETGEGMPFYQGVRDFGTRFPIQRVWTTAPVRTAAKRDTLISVRAPVGRTNLAREDLCLGRGLAGLRSLTSTPMCLFHQVRSARDAWAPYEAEGTVFGAINKDALKGISIPSIPDTKLNQLERQLDSLEALIEQSLLENLTLAHTRDQLLPLLMSGKVTVKDLEGDIEDVV